MTVISSDFFFPKKFKPDLFLDDGAMVNQLKRSKRELEQNFQELQEEFDELLAENQQTEQARDRFQVQNERDRQQAQRQLEAKDQEIGENNKFSVMNPAESGKYSHFIKFEIKEENRKIKYISYFCTLRTPPPRRKI